MGKRGPKPSPIDWETVKKLAHIQCTQEEIAHVIGFSVDWLDKRCPRDNNGVKLSEFIKRGAAGGKMSLRRWQWKSAESGDVTMLIWLGKNYLEQSNNGLKTPASATASSEQEEVQELAKWLSEVESI